MLRSVPVTGRVISIVLFGLSVASGASRPRSAGAPCLPADNIWNTPVDQLATVSTSSSAWVTTIGTTKPVHADFGSGVCQWSADRHSHVVTDAGTRINGEPGQRLPCA